MSEGLNLSEIEKALEKMTPGPWEVPESLLGIPNTTVFGESGQVVYFQTRHLNEALGICLLRNETPKLIAALRDAEDGIDHYQDRVRDLLVNLHDRDDELVLRRDEVCEAQIENDKLRAALRAVEKLAEDADRNMAQHPGPNPSGIVWTRQIRQALGQVPGGELS